MAMPSARIKNGHFTIEFMASTSALVNGNDNSKMGVHALDIKLVDWLRRVEDGLMANSSPNVSNSV